MPFDGQAEKVDTHDFAGGKTLRESDAGNLKSSVVRRVINDAMPPV